MPSCKILKNCYNGDMKYHKKLSKKGFTLAEVLITLGIVGVVAAITLPSISAKIQKNMLVEQLKTFYSSFTNAINLYMYKGGYEDFSQTIFADSSVSFEDKKEHFISEVLEKNLQGKRTNVTITEDCLKGDKRCFTYSFDYVTSKGSLIKFEKSMWNSLFTIYFDTNGTKGPNRVGLDAFRFYFYDSPVPKQAYQRDTDYACTGCGDSCNLAASSPTGYGCWARIMREGWKINY